MHKIMCNLYFTSENMKKTKHLRLRGRLHKCFDAFIFLNPNDYTNALMHLLS